MVNESPPSPSASSSVPEISATAASEPSTSQWSQDHHSRNSLETVGVRPNSPILPIMQQRDLIEREMRWLIPLGVAHLQSLWEDDETDSRILDAVMDYALTTTGDRRGQQVNSEGEHRYQQGEEEEEEEEGGHSQYQSNTHFYSSPYELLMTLDAARRSVRSRSMPFLPSCAYSLLVQ
jgi:hypothetical protein